MRQCSVLSLALLLASLGVTSAQAALPSPGACQPQTVAGDPLVMKAPAATLALRIAADPDTREYGLMCVLSLPAHGGMLFVFPGPDADHSFWMKNTLIPLDMVWVTSRGIVTTVAANVPATTVETPYDKIPQRNGHGTYVIELAAGEAARAGIKPGVHLDVSQAPKAKN
jgi:uncharacterized membrane protein (UPF0127 family)